MYIAPTLSTAYYQVKTHFIAPVVVWEFQLIEIYLKYRLIQSELFFLTQQIICDVVRFVPKISV